MPVSDSTDVLLLNPPYIRRIGGSLMPPIGLCYLAAILRENGCHPHILDVAALYPELAESSANTDRLIAALKDLAIRPSLIGIGPLVTATLRTTKSLIEICRNRFDAPIVLGGPLCSVSGFDKVNRDFLTAEFFIAGDGESPLLSLWKNLIGDDASLGGLHSSIGGNHNSTPVPHREPSIDVLPLPARDLLADGYHASARRCLGSPLKRSTAAFLSRGCPYSCTFCAAPLASGKVVRRLSPNRVVLELDTCADGHFSEIVFYDDCLFIRSPNLDRRVLDFADTIKRSHWKGSFQLELRCDAVVALSDSALDALKGAGCRQINMGIEKAHSKSLIALRKQLTPSIARGAVKRLADAGIRSAGTFILGGPNETSSDLYETIEFALSLPLTFAHFNPLAIYPGTELFRQVFGSRCDGSWLELCLDRLLAPAGDILWHSDAIPMTEILSAISFGYTNFYTTERLCRQIIPTDQELESLSASYDTLRDSRAHSWSQWRTTQFHEASQIC